MKFSEKLSAIYCAITSKEDAKPDLYMYETKTWDVSCTGSWNQVYDDHCVYTDFYKMDDAKSVYENYGADFRDLDVNEDRHFTAKRTELYKISPKTIKKYFSCESAGEFYGKAEPMWFHKNEAGEAFLDLSGFNLAYSDGELYIGFGEEDLKEFVILPESDEPVYDLEFEEYE